MRETVLHPCRNTCLSQDPAAAALVAMTGAVRMPMSPRQALLLEAALLWKTPLRRTGGCARRCIGRRQ